MRLYQSIIGGVVLTTFGIGVCVHPDPDHHPHTLANSFGIVYVAGTSAHQLVTAEVVEFLRDVVKPNSPISPSTFVLA